MPRLLISLLALLSLAACQTVNPATGERQFSLVSPEQEAVIGRQEHARVLEQFGGVYEEDVELNAYVAGVGAQVAAASELPNNPWRFTVLNSPIVNAFALPGGYVYISRGLLVLANNEAQLAGVLGHEVGHVTARHGATRMTQGQVGQIGATLLGVLTGSREIAQAANLAGAAVLASYSRDQEYESDLLGVRYASRSRYDPMGQAQFLAALDAHTNFTARLAGREAELNQFGFFATHPPAPDRVLRATQAANQAGSGGRNGRDAYLNVIDGMLYGDDPSQGLIKGTGFFHPDLRFAFRVPEGFTLINGTTQVGATSRDQGQIVFDADRYPRGLPMRDYLRDRWLRDVNFGGLRAGTVNDMDIATATVRGRDGGLIFAAAVRHPSDTVYRFLMQVPQGQDQAGAQRFQDTVSTFRVLGAEEAAGLLPRRIRVHTVRAGETVASLSRRMAFERDPEGWLRTLNQMSPTDQVRPGDRVKLVVEEAVR